MRRYSIAALMLVILVSAVAIAALKQASDTWAGILLILTLLLLGTAVFGATYRRERRRAFWLGFAVFGWGYLTLSAGPWFSDQVAPKLPTTLLLNYAHAKANPEQQRVGAVQVLTRLAPPPGGPQPVQVQGSPITVTGNVILANGSGASGTQTLSFFLMGQTNLEQFTRVGHCLFALLAAIVGGLIAQGFQRTNRAAAE